MADWQNSCKSAMHQVGLSWSRALTNLSSHIGNTHTHIRNDTLIRECSYNNTVPKRYKKVMVITGAFDNNFHHMISDSLTRLARYLRLVRRDPEIMIHMREMELTTNEEELLIYFEEAIIAKKSRQEFFLLLGINSSRIIHGPVIADTVYIPRETTCSYILRNPLELRHLAKTLRIASQQYMLKRQKRDPTINKFSFVYDEIVRTTVNPVAIYYQADDTNYPTQMMSTLTDTNTDKKVLKKNIIILHRQGKL